MTKQADSERARHYFAVVHGMPYETVQKLVRMANKAWRLMEYVCNGEPVHRANTVPCECQCSAWKEENCRLWQIESDKIDREILAMLAPYGFDFELEYNGLFPTLKKNGEDVRIPF